MAEKAKKPPTGPEVGAAPAPQRSKLLSRLMIVAFVAGVIVIQLVLAMAFMSSIGQSAPPPEPDNLEHQVEKEIDREAEGSISGSTLEVDLGEFSVTSYQPSSEITLRIDFHLFGTVAESNQSLFQSHLERNRNRIREQVLVTMRNAELSDLTDPGLGLIKRRILTKVNRTLGKPLLKTVVISDFSFVEQ